MIRRVVALVLFVWILGSSPLWATDGNVIGLEAFLRIARQSDKAAAIVLHDKKQLAYLEDLMVSSSALLASIQNEYGFAFGEGDRSMSLRGGLEKSFEQTGTSLSGSYTKNKRENVEEEVIRLDLEQSLFKNAFGKQARHEKQVAEWKKEAVVLELVEAFEDYTEQAIGAYLDWQLGILKRVVVQRIYEDAKRLQVNIKRRFRQSVANRVDVDRIGLQVLVREDALAAAEVELVHAEEAVQAMASFDQTDSRKPETQIRFLDQRVVPKPEDPALLTNSRGLAALRLSEKIERAEADILDEELDPDLKFLAGFQYDDSRRYTTSTTRKEALVGFSLDWPFFNAQGRAKVQEAAFQAGAARLQKELFEQQLRADLISNAADIAQNRKRVTVGSEKVRLAKRVLKAETARYEQGRVDLETLISAQQSLAQTHLDELTSQTALAKSVVAWLRLVDQLIQREALF